MIIIIEKYTRNYQIYKPGITVGDIIRKLIQAAPDPWPIRVIFVGSPPNNAIFC